MEIIKIRGKNAKEIHDKILSEMENLVPEEVKNDLRKMSAICAHFDDRLHKSKAISHKDVDTYNELCYKHFGMLQDGEEFEKEERPAAHMPKKKAMLSQPMAGRSMEEIEGTREKAIKVHRRMVQPGGHA